MHDIADQIGLRRLRDSPGAPTGYGVTVAVLDSGIDPSQPWLRVTKSVSTCPESVNVSGRHGTHCAGVIASRHPEYPGIAPGVRLVNIKVARANGLTQPDYIARGIEEAIALRADILSISVGLNHSPPTQLGGHGWRCSNGSCTLCRTVDRVVWKKNVLVVAAAGNEHLRTAARQLLGREAANEVLCPGQARSAITVGAVEKPPGSRLFGASSRSSGALAYAKPELVAPGVNVTSTVPVQWTARGGLGLASGALGAETGTSVAAAVVAGALALLVEWHLAMLGEWSAPAVREELLTRCVRPLRALDGFPRRAVGAGLLDLSRFRLVARS